MNKKAVLSFIFILTSHTVWSYQNHPMDRDIIEDIFQQAESCVDRVEQERIYFKPETIYSEHGKIFLLNEFGQEIAIPHLFTSDSGPYLELTRMERYWICTTPTCQTAYYKVEPKECLICHTRSFIIRWR